MSGVGSEHVQLFFNSAIIFMKLSLIEEDKNVIWQTEPTQLSFNIVNNSSDTQIKKRGGYRMISTGCVIVHLLV